MARADQLSGPSVFFGIVLLVVAAALGVWTAIASDDPARALQLASDAAELPFGPALVDYALRNLHVPATLAALFAAAGVGSIAEGIGFPVVSALLRLATGSVIFAAGGALAAWTVLGVQDPAAALEWAARGDEFVAGTGDFAARALPALPLLGAAAAFLLIFGAIELWRSRRGFNLAAARAEPRDDGDMRHALQAAAAAARPQPKPKFVELDGDYADLVAAPAPGAHPRATMAKPAPAATFSADPPIVQSIERMLVRVTGSASNKLNAHQKAALAKLPREQQETLVRFADLVPEGKKLAMIAIGVFVALQVIGSLVGGSR